MQANSLFHFSPGRILLLFGDALLITLAVALSYAVAFIGESALLLSLEGFYSVLLYWLGTLLVFAYGGLYAKPSLDFTKKKFKWLAMMNVYVVGAVFLTEYVLDPEIWLFALVFMMFSFAVRTVTSAFCVFRGSRADFTMIAVIPFVIGAIACLTITPKILHFAPLPNKTLAVSGLATLLYFVYSTALLSLGRLLLAKLMTPKMEVPL
ncbi:MAG: hypothetical protein J6Z31_08825 [Fibrobacter sp.]|nr:hypothetical protein [Fibrobacter sp.]